jgi:hypothetical protein
MSSELVVYGSLEGFRRWLDYELFRRFGRATSNRSICIKAGLPENALYRVLTKGERPSPLFCERMAEYLGLKPEELERRAGLRPVLEVGYNGELTGVDMLSEEERASVRRAFAEAVDALKSMDGARTPS